MDFRTGVRLRLQNRMKLMGWFLLIIVYCLVVDIVSAGYGIVTGCNFRPWVTSVPRVILAMFLPVIFVFAAVMWLPKARNHFSLRARLTFIAIWFTPSAVWFGSLVLRAAGWVRIAQIVYDYRYTSILIAIAVVMWQWYRSLAPTYGHPKASPSASHPVMN